MERFRVTLDAMTPIIEDSTAGGGEIVIGLNGSKETYVLKGEELSLIHISLAALTNA